MGEVSHELPSQARDLAWLRLIYCQLLRVVRKEKRTNYKYPFSPFFPSLTSALILLLPQLLWWDWPCVGSSPSWIVTVWCFPTEYRTSGAAPTWMSLSFRRGLLPIGLKLRPRACFMGCSILQATCITALWASLWLHIETCSVWCPGAVWRQFLYNIPLHWPSYFFLDHDVCRAVFLVFSQSSLTVPFFFSFFLIFNFLVFLKYVIIEAKLILTSGDSLLQLSGAGSIKHRSSFWWLLAETVPAVPVITKLCYVSSI